MLVFIKLFFRNFTKMKKMYIPNLLEFLYDCFESRGKDFLFERLNREELKKIKNEAKIKTFVEKSRFEDQAIVLSKLNYGVGLVIWDKEKQTNNNVKDVLIANLELQGNDFTRTLIKSKVFAIQSIDIIKALQVTSKASLAPTWSVNRKYLDISRHKEKKGFSQRNIATKFEAEATLKWYIETISTAIKIAPLLEHYKIEITHFQILLYLQNCPNGASIESVKKEVNNHKGFRNIIINLEKMNMIEFGSDKSIMQIGVNGYVTIDAIISKFP